MPTCPLAWPEADTKPYRAIRRWIRRGSHNSGVLGSSMCRARRCRLISLFQGKMSSRFLNVTGAVAVAVLLSLSPKAFAQSDDADAEMRIEKLENQLRQLTGQNEELQYRNRQLEERLRQLGAAPPPAPGQPAQPSVAAVPPAQSGPSYNQPPAQGGYPQQQAAYPQQPGYGQ